MNWFVIDKQDCNKIDADISVLEADLEKVKVELEEAGVSLEDAVRLWSNFNNLVIQFETWFKSAENALQKPLEFQQASIFLVQIQ